MPRSKRPTTLSGPAPTLGWAVALFFLLGGGAVVEAVAQRLPTGIYALDGIEADLPTDDLEPLRRIVRKARIVGLGESVHTTRGFSQAKVRVIRYMIEEMGFRAVGIESPWVGADRVSRYVETCSRSPENALRGLFGVWQNVSVLELVRWMCDWNRDHPDDPVFFYGFDHQQLRADALGLRDYLVRIGFSPDDDLVERVFQCRRLAAPDRQELDACLAALDEVTAYFDDHESELIAQTSAEQLEYARLHVVGLSAHQRQVFHRQRRQIREWFEARDEGMAIIAATIRRLRFPRARTVLWAHNGHVARGEFVPESRSMGGFLKQLFRNKYKAVALIAFEAEVDWPGVGCGLYATAAPGSLEARLRDLGEPYLLVDLAFRGAAEPFLPAGHAFDVNWGAELVPRRSFHGLLYMERAAKMEPLLWPPC